MTDKKFRTQDIRAQTITNAMAKPLVHMLILVLSPPNILLTHLNSLLFRLICNTPIENRGLSVDLQPFFYGFDDENINKNRHMRDRLSLSAAILAQLWCLVAF